MGEQGYSSNEIAGDRAAGGAGGALVGGQTDRPGYTWIDGGIYGAGGLDGAVNPEDQVVPTAVMAVTPTAVTLSGIVIVAVTV